MSDRASTYFDVQHRVAEMLARLDAFVAGEKTAASLVAWAEELWALDDTQRGPIASNLTATRVLVDMMNAGTSLPGGAEAFRVSDASECVRSVRHGPDVARSWELATSPMDLGVIAERVGVEPTHHVVDGLGWHATLCFASLATGRAFAMHRALDESVVGPGPARLMCVPGGDRHEALRDLLETLALDRDDLEWVHPEAKADLLPRWSLERQDDHGVTVEVASFSGRRKAEAAFARYEGLMHKQTYGLVEASEVFSG